jgi:hypothetical protein
MINLTNVQMETMHIEEPEPEPRPEHENTAPIVTGGERHVGVDTSAVILRSYEASLDIC